VYHLLNLLADEGRWDDLLAQAADPAGAAGERRHVAHVVAVAAPLLLRAWEAARRVPARFVDA
jgi:hypothetical protein